MCTEKECRSVSRRTRFRLPNLFVILLDLFLMVGEIVLDFGDLRIISKSYLLFNRYHATENTETAI